MDRRRRRRRRAPCRTLRIPEVGDRSHSVAARHSRRGHVRVQGWRAFPVLRLRGHQAAMLELRDLSLSYGSTQVLNGVNFRVERGDVVSIIGPSGTGKTTLLKCINYLAKPTSGTITFDQIRMDYQRVDKAAVQAIRLRTAMVFQQFNVFKNMTVIQNVMDPLVVVQRKSKGEAREIALQELERGSSTLQMDSNKFPSGAAIR